MRPAFVTGLLIVTPLSLLAQFRIPVPHIPGVPGVSVPIPGIEDLMNEEPAVSTSLEDAQTENTLMDDYDPIAPKSLLDMPRGEAGSFLLTPGNYELDAQSYCLHAGTHSPGSGNGYLYAPLQGKREEIIRHILENSVDHPAIAQRNIQLLIWGILAHTKLSDMPGELQDTARQLLSDREVRSLNGGALGLIPNQARGALFANLPANVRSVFEAEADIRQLLTEGTSSYDELERVAVLAGDAPTGEGSREVPSGRWSYHPGGYFVRYFPSGYSETQVQVSVPEPTSIERDDLGRITAIADEDGNRIETTYDDSIAPLTVSGDPSLIGYAFSTIRFVHPDPSAANGVREMTWEKTGWTFVEQNLSAKRPAALTAQVANELFNKQFTHSQNDSNLLAQAGDRFGNWRDRYQTAQEWRDRVNYYRDRWEARTGDRSDADIENLTDLGHYREGIETATRGTEGDRLDWIIRHHERSANALEYAICVLEGGCQDDHNGAIDFNPATDVAVPANTSRQRLAQSARPYGQ